MSDVLFINGSRVDLKDDDQAGITKAANDLGDMASRQGSYSYTIRLPKTDNNRRVMENAHSTISGTRLPYQRLTCDYYSGGVQLIADGFGVIQDAGLEYNLNIFSSNAGLFQLIDGKKLADLDTSSYDLLWNHSNVVACYGNNITPITLLIDDGTLSETARAIDSKKMFFHPYFKDVLNALFTDAGYSVINLPTGNDFTKALFPFVNEYPVQGLSEIANSEVSASEVIEVYGVGTTAELNIVCTDNAVDGSDVGNNYDAITGEYTVPYAGRIKVSGHIVTDAIWSGVVTTLNADIVVKKNGVDAQVIDAYSASTVNANDNNYTDFETSVDCQAGDLLTVHFRYSQFSSQFNIGIKQGGNTTGGETSIGFSLDEELLWGGKWYINRNLPDMTQKDFLKMFCNLFGLSFYVDDFSKVINFYSVDDVILNKGQSTSQNWSDYYDSGTAMIKFHSRFAQVNDMVFTQDDEVPQFTGDAQFIITDTTLPERSQAFKLPVAASIEVKRLRGIDMAQVLRVDIDGNDVTPKPRILSVVNSAFPSPNVNDYLRIQESGTGNINDFFTAYSARFTHDLARIGLAYYSGWINILNDYKAVTAQFRLPAYVVANFAFNTAVYVREMSAWFYVNKIENYKNGKLCKVELQLI
jgi:hypothetical protein